MKWLVLACQQFSNVEFVQDFKSPAVMYTAFDCNTVTFSSSLIQVDLDLFDTTDGQYQLGLQVSCADEMYVSDTISLSIDRAAPYALRNSVVPPGHSLTVGGDIGVSFSEPIDCSSLVMGASLDDGAVFAVGSNMSLVCSGTTLHLLFEPEQVQRTMH